MHKFLIGIDEAGRGPLAGPVSVCAFMTGPANSKLQTPNSKQILNTKIQKLPNHDSKQLTAKQREIWFASFQANKQVFYAVESVSAKMIDKIGIVKSIQKALNKAVEKLEKSADVNHKNSFIMLDGLLHAPEKYKQETIIKGDEKIPVISAASITAKVTRDKLMLKMHKKFPQYCFDKHKGYGTKLHYEKIKKYGLCELHRRSYLTHPRPLS